ncbi:MAG: hypothetical protein ACRD1C_13160 [Terriglobales bacterium]
MATLSITTAHARSERLVVLAAGEHPFLQHESVAAYAYAALEQVAAIESALRSGAAAAREPAEPSLLRRLQMGLLDSEHTPNHVLQFAREAGWGRG